jgi:hypothetical protein
MVYIGIDGEGQGREDHRYVLLAASTLDGRREWTAEAPNKHQCLDVPAEYSRGLTTVECLDLILSLPAVHTRIFSFSFNYDMTKILQDLPNETLYRLFHPDLPERKPKGKLARFKGPEPVTWNGYELNLQGTRFWVRRTADRRTIIVWDLFKFFQGKFVTAIEDWRVGDEETRAFIRLMKDRREDFDKLPPADVRRYCLQECRYIADLAGRLISAAEKAELRLKSFYGAGSLGAAMLDVMGIRDKLAPTPPEMFEAVAASFAGGRFENSGIGPFREPLSSWDISSAYVYQLAFLPCLLHGCWRHTTKREAIEGSKVSANGALVRYSLDTASYMRNVHGEDHIPVGSWGPFPFRHEKGRIAFPIESGGGWVWLDEYLAGEKIFPNVRFHEAFVYERNCDCRPFERIPEFYSLRLRIGKEGPGIVIKLGMNSCYGKLAQTLGSALYNNWIWASQITSGCRAQLLEMLWLHRDPANLLMLATDGVLSREDVCVPMLFSTRTCARGTRGCDREHTFVPPRPLDTGTGGTGKPLGGWEHKSCPRGVFMARPGIYFPLDLAGDDSDCKGKKCGVCSVCIITAIRARGVGRSVILKNSQLIVDAWERDGIAGIATMPSVTRFCGAKTSISVSGRGDERVYKRANGTGSEPRYGQWISRKVEMTFDPLPKRARVNPDGRTLELRKFPAGQTSEPYEKALRRMRGQAGGEETVTPETAMMRRAEQEALEQPDGDLTEFEVDHE